MTAGPVRLLKVRRPVFSCGPCQTEEGEALNG